MPWNVGLLLGFGLMGGVSLSVVKYFKTDRTSNCQSQLVTYDSTTDAETEFGVIHGVTHRLCLAVRFAYLCYLFTPAVTFYLLSWLFNNATLANFSWKYTLSALQASGPAFIKLGQWASTRRDLFPNEFCAILSDLHLHCLPHPWKDTERLMEASFGPNWQQTVCIVDHTPIGSGCVAQVYQGRLYRRGNSFAESARSVSAGSSRDGSIVCDSGTSVASGDSKVVSGVEVATASDNIVGEPVAVKVLHPNIVLRMEQDICLMKYVASWVDTLYPAVYWVALTECVDEFAIIMEKQVRLG